MVDVRTVHMRWSRKMATPATTGNINTAVKQGDNIRGGDQILIQNNTSSVTDSLQVDR